MIEVKHLKKAFQKKQVLKDVNFNIPSGECTALIGKNGAGKSTLIDILIGDLERSWKIRSRQSFRSLEESSRKGLDIMIYET